MKIKKMIKRIKKKKREIQVGDVFFNPLSFEIEVTNVHKRGTFVVKVKDYGNLATPEYLSILSKKSLENLDLEYAGRVEYRQRLFSFLPDKRVWVEKA